MSKEKKVKTKIKRKTTALDIVSRIITAIAAAAVPVIVYFANLIYLVVDSTVFQLIAKIRGDATDDGSTYDYISIRDVVVDYLPIFKNMKPSEDGANIAETIAPIKTALICAGVFLALAIVFALVIFFVSCFSNSNKLPLIFSALGFASAIALFVAFNAASKPIVDGTISISSFISNAILGAIAPYVAKVSILHLSTAWVLMLVIFAAIFIWHGAQLLVTAGEDKQGK